MTQDAQRDLLVSRLQALRSRRSGVAVVLCGQPGIGKTHLAGSVLLNLGCRQLSVAATSSVRALLMALPPAPLRPAWTEPVFEQVMRGESPSPATLLDAVAAHLQASAPLVLHIEDLHEASVHQQLFWVQYLRQGRSERRGRSLRRRAPLLWTSITERPEAADTRQEIGHLEADLMEGAFDTFGWFEHAHPHMFL